MILFWIIFALTSVIWITMLLTALIMEPTPGRKVGWGLVVFLLHFIGAMIYFVVRRTRRATPPP